MYIYSRTHTGAHRRSLCLCMHICIQLCTLYEFLILFCNLTTALILWTIFILHVHYSSPFLRCWTIKIINGREGMRKKKLTNGIQIMLSLLILYNHMEKKTVLHTRSKMENLFKMANHSGIKHYH